VTGIWNDLAFAQRGKVRKNRRSSASSASFAGDYMFILMESRLLQFVIFGQWLSLRIASIRFNDLIMGYEVRIGNLGFREAREVNAGLQKGAW
jgi:hypothetical protein